MQNSSSSKPLVERRAGVERRKIDLGPPNGIERRRGIDPRKPEVKEVDLTASDWVAFEAGDPLKPKLPPKA